MTGNNKVWRAPLAGLAAVAMLATMGVAAGTANAATAPSQVSKYNFSVTLHANTPAGLKDAATVDGASTKNIDFYTLDGANGSDHDGVLDQLYSVSQAAVDAPSGWVFTGWYTGADYGSTKFDFENTVVTKHIDLYAHYAEPDQRVNFLFEDSSLYDASNYVYFGKANATGARNFYNPSADGSVILTVAAQDKLAKWELPADNAGDHKVVKSWKVGPKAGEENDTVTFDQLVNSYVGKLTHGVGPFPVYLKPADPSPASVVKYYEYEEPTAPLIYGPVDVAYGDAVPTSPRIDGQFTVSQWAYTDPVSQKEVQVKDGFTASEALKDLNLYAAGSSTETFKVTFVTEVNGFDTTVAVEYVAKGDSPKGSFTPSRDDNYTFAGWSETSGYNQKTVSLSSLKISKDTTLYAQWATNQAGVTFDYQYASKIDTKSYAADQEFNAPSPSRAGYEFLGWYTWKDASRSGSPIASTFIKQFRKVDGKKVVQWFDKSKGDAGNNVQTSTSGWLNDVSSAVQIPANAKLRINGKGVLQYQRVTVTETPNGDKTSTDWVDVAGTLYAAWGVTGKDALSKDESVAPSIKGDNSDYVTDNADFVNYPAYLAAMKQYYAHKAELGGDNANLTDDQIATLTSELNAAVALLQERTDTTVYRLYNRWSGDHLYTTDLKEYEKRAKQGWTEEGKQFQVLAANKYGLSTAVYRLYNPYNDEHLLTADPAEVSRLENRGWVADNDGKPAFYAPQGGDVSVTRLFNPFETQGTHLYTTDQGEANSNIKRGWLNDGVIFKTR